MKPSQLAAALRRIAARIEASKQPSRVLVSRDLRRVLANMEKPSKPSDLLATGPVFGGRQWSLVYRDPASQEYPFVGFRPDGDDLLICSFTSQEEVSAWVGDPAPGSNEMQPGSGDPDNVEPIDPADADELAAGLQLHRVDDY